MRNDEMSAVTIETLYLLGVLRIPERKITDYKDVKKLLEK